MRPWWPVVVGLVLFAPAASRAQSDHAHPAGDLGRVGKTHFPVSCAPALQPDFDRAVAILHSFFYEESERQFESIAARDPRCAMAWWGVAMSLWHPLWEPPDSTSLARGWAAIQHADSLRAGTDRERAYIAAMAYLLPGLESRRPPHPGARLRARDAATARRFPGRHRGRDLLRPGTQRDAPVQRQDLRAAAPRRRDSRAHLCEPARPPGGRALPHPQL